ncbi:HpcH/HpaI aldolase family protein [Limnochorda pilosa]|uniref:Aldolase n=1 Tax=Limnochorda pilosa TaxID=1555112 RepID=A0A0K2SL43_LIMPI|nr:aldolase/citrate lyase family protein [Limnochorda pilosa]BAS27820.1 aldolase [Limnochorda pilosa]
MGNRVKERLKQGLPSVGNWINIPSPAVAELLAGHGMDWLLVDTEHCPTDYETIENLLRAMRGTEVVPLVRVAGNDPVLIKKALDRGALGVLVPLVNSAEEAAAAVAAAKYPPEGIRGVAGTRASRYGADLRAYFASWNQDVLVAVQVETRQALEQVEAIAAVPGVDVVFIGPNDLSANLGVFQQYDHPAFAEAVARVLRATRAHGVAAGYMASDSASVLAKIEEGFTFVSAGSDTRLLSAAAAATYGAIERGLGERGFR